LPANGVGGLTKNLALLELVEPEALPCGAAAAMWLKRPQSTVSNVNRNFVATAQKITRSSASLAVTKLRM